jgi:mannitol/fructose-specific phosphotransferase system IIA component (Ntr-type)
MSMSGAARVRTAVPHAKHANIRVMVCAIATFPTGIEFGSLDGEPVRTVCMILSPHDKTGDTLRAIERVARYLRGRARRRNGAGMRRRRAGRWNHCDRIGSP